MILSQGSTAYNPPPESFDNRGLFSDYYLKERLSDSTLTAEWAEELHPIGQALSRLLAAARDTYTSEAVIRRGLYEPIFTLLGLEAVEQKDTLSSGQGADYLLYAPGEPEDPIAAALTYAWDRALDDVDLARELPEAQGGRPFEVPGATVVSLLEAQVAPWVIVTNGKRWRLYSATVSNKATSYYEVDLEEALDTTEQQVELKYWWLFFRRQAFTGFLDTLLKRSTDHVREVGERLKERIFAEVFPPFAQGFIEDRRAQGAGVDEAALEEVFSGTMTFLYRLLFILYAESRELLPPHEFNLWQLEQEIAHFEATSSVLYARLQRLFEVINLSTYGGALFSPHSEAGQFLLRHAIPDRFLALGLERLVRDVDVRTKALLFIDFESLGVRHLGSIHEALLGCRLQLAGDGRPYLAHDKRARKSSGSYYTPEHIVRYIVQHTVGPVLARKFEALTPRLHAAQQGYRDREEASPNPGKYWERWENQPLVDDCLNVCVLDPAMGSGHFLVEVVDYISHRLISFLNGWSENPIWAFLERTRDDILGEMERQHVTVDRERLTRVALLKRAVLKRCVYGVDLDAMAVELAKVSLWLDTFTRGAPLSFLDHHLKHGNSLLGARIGEAPLDLFSDSKGAGLRVATELMRKVSCLSDSTVEQCHQSAAIYHAACDHLAPYKHLLDKYTARWFGKASLPKRAVRDAGERCFFHWELEFPELFFAPGAPGSEGVALLEGGGFDAVVGNPPYERTSELSSDKEFYSKRFLAATGSYDISVLFVELATRLVADRGMIGQIVSNKLLVTDYGKGIRNLLHRYTSIERIVDLTECHTVFKDALVSSAIVILKKTPPESDSETLIAIFARDTPDLLAKINRPAPNETPAFVYDSRAQASLLDDLTGHLNIYMVGAIKAIVDKVYESKELLGTIASVRTGIMGFNYWSIEPITKEAGEAAQDARPLLSPGLLDRYESRWGIDCVHLFKTAYHAPVIEPDERVVDSNTWQLFTREKVIISGIARRLTAIYDSEGMGMLVTIHAARARGALSNLYLTALINSNLLNWLHRVKYYSARIPQGSLRYPISFLEKLPIVPITFATTPAERERRKEEAIETYRSGNDEGILQRTQRALDTGQSDVVHDLLVYLAQSMMELHKEKQSESGRFLTWLESRLCIHPDKRGATGIDSLRGKRRLRDYLGDYQKGEREIAWCDFRRRLYQNRHRFPVALSGIEGELEQAYLASLDRLLPLKHALSRTDTLINKIIYRLYQLTEAEIELIERAENQERRTRSTPGW